MKLEISYIRILIPFSLGTFIAIALSGCASSPVEPRGVSFTEPTKLTAAPIQPYAETYPVANLQRPAPKTYPTNEEPLPVWENSQIQKVAVDAYVDENGNLHPQSFMYVVTKKGGWNLDAVRKPNNYIPPENSVAPINGFGISYGKSFTQATTPQNNSASLLLTDTSQLRITGLTNPQDGEAARSQIDPVYEVAVFDPFVGWIIAPKKAVESPISVQNVYREEAARATISEGGIVSPPNKGIRRTPSNQNVNILAAPQNFPNTPTTSVAPIGTPNTHKTPENIPQQQSDTQSLDKLFNDF